MSIATRTTDVDELTQGDVRLPLGTSLPDDPTDVLVWIQDELIPLRYVSFEDRLVTQVDGRLTDDAQEFMGGLADVANLVLRRIEALISRGKIGRHPEEIQSVIHRTEACLGAIVALGGLSKEAKVFPPVLDPRYEWEPRHALNWALDLVDSAWRELEREIGARRGTREQDQNGIDEAVELVRGAVTKIEQALEKWSWDFESELTPADMDEIAVVAHDVAVILWGVEDRFSHVWGRSPKGRAARETIWQLPAIMLAAEGAVESPNDFAFGRVCTRAQVCYRGLEVVAGDLRDWLEAPGAS